MKVVTGNEEKRQFKDVKQATVFEYRGEYYLKTPDIYANTRADIRECSNNAIDLKTGYFSWFRDDAEVRIYPDAKVVLGVPLWEK